MNPAPLLFIGPSDLGIALGLCPGASDVHPVLANAIRRIQDAGRAAAKVTGIWCGSAEMARTMQAPGLEFVVPGQDAIWLKAENARRLAVVRGSGAGGMRAGQSVVELAEEPFGNRTECGGRASAASELLGVPK